MIDDDIRQALKVDPSPEFVARVRTRVAEEPEPSAWRWSWSLAGAAALAAAVMIAVVVSRPAPHVATPMQEPDVVQAFRPATPDESTTAGLKPPTPAVDRSAKAFALLEPAEAVARPAAPEILIDPRERQALLRLIAGVREGRVDLSAAHNSTTTTLPELEPVTDIVIAPITIDPLAPLFGAEGVRP